MFDTGSGDHWAELELTAMSSNKIGPAVRMINNANFLSVYLGGSGGGGLRSYEKISGVLFQSTAEQGVAGNKYRVSVTDNGDGTSDFELLEDGVGMPDGPTIISNIDFPTTSHNAGIINDATNVASSITYWNNFDGGDFGGGGSSVTFSTSGGVAVSGAANLLMGFVFAPSAGMSFAGASPLIRSKVEAAPVGGLSMTGSVDLIVAKIMEAIGGVTYSGASIVSTHESTRDWSVFGGISWSGVASWVRKAFTLEKLRLPFLTHAGPVSGNVTSSADQNVVSE